MTESGVISKTAMVFGQMNEPPGARMRVGLSGLTMAEYFRDVKHQDVLLFIDNIFRFTQAGSEVSALLGLSIIHILGTCLAADKAESKDVKGGTVLMRSSYIFRLLVLFVLLVVCAKSGIFNLIALVLPLVFVRPVLTVAEFFRKKEG